MIHQYSVQEVQLLYIHSYTLYAHILTSLSLYIYIKLFYNWKVCEYSLSTERSKGLN